MTKRILLGMLTPSSNTALEPITTAMVAGLPEVSAHFSRFKVTEIALSNTALAQFDSGVAEDVLAAPGAIDAAVLGRLCGDSEWV